MSAHNDVVIVTHNGDQLIARNAPGDPGNGTTYRAERIAERPPAQWICDDPEAPGCVYVVPAASVERVWVRKIG